VRFVKFQGETSTSYNLRSDDFLLVLASDAQLIGAQRFCGPRKEVAYLDLLVKQNSAKLRLRVLCGLHSALQGVL